MRIKKFGKVIIEHQLKYLRVKQYQLTESVLQGIKF